MAPTTTKNGDAAEAPVKRGRGRPPMDPSKKKAKPEPSGRPRGRPKGSGVKKTSTTPKKAAAKGARVSKRIAENEEAVTDALKANGETPVTAGKRGRPAKGGPANSSKAAAKPKATGGKRGRPSKYDAEEEAEAEEVEDQEDQEETGSEDLDDDQE